MYFISERYSGSWRYLRYSQLSPMALAFMLCTAIIIVRNPVAVFRAEFWAEDATQFFFGSLSLGLKSLITPVVGYHCFISRVIAYIATFFPVLWTPFIYALTSLLINAGVASYFSRQSFSWIILSRPFRIFVCTILAMGPGTSEAFLNLANLSYVLTFFGLLLLIEKPWRLSVMKFAILGVLTLSLRTHVFADSCRGISLVSITGSKVPTSYALVYPGLYSQLGRHPLCGRRCKSTELWLYPVGPRDFDRAVLYSPVFHADSRECHHRCIDGKRVDVLASVTRYWRCLFLLWI